MWLSFPRTVSRNLRKSGGDLGKPGTMVIHKWPIEGEFVPASPFPPYLYEHIRCATICYLDRENIASSGLGFSQATGVVKMEDEIDNLQRNAATSWLRTIFGLHNRTTGD